MTEIMSFATSQDRLQKIASMHVKYVDDHGGTDGFCNDCHWLWPCPTYRWATEEYVDVNCTWDLRDCGFDHDHEVKT